MKANKMPPKQLGSILFSGLGTIPESKSSTWSTPRFQEEEYGGDESGDEETWIGGATECNSRGGSTPLNVWQRLGT